MTENPGRLRALMDDTLTDEPPLLDLVPDAVTGAEQGRRRGRMMAGGAAVAVLAVTVGAYGVADHGRSGVNGSPVVPPGASRSSTSAAPPVRLSHKSTLGIPDLFDHPGTPQQECAKVNGPVLDSKAQLSSPAERNYCIQALQTIRALLPDAVVVLNPFVDFNQPAWSAPLIQTPDGGTAPGFTQAYQQGAKNSAKTVYLAGRFAFRTANGEGSIIYNTTPPGVKAKPQPGGDLPLGDGTAGRIAHEDSGTIDVTGVTAGGVWYRLDISGVGPVYGASGSTLEPNLRTDGKGHSVFPDGYVVAGDSALHMHIPNPYTETEVRQKIVRMGLGNVIPTIGVDPLSDYPAPSAS